MSVDDITPQEALQRLGASTAEAIAQVLETFCPDGVRRGEVSVVLDTDAAFASLPQGAVATSVSYVDGVSGANIFVLTPDGARTLAQSMGVPPLDNEDDPTRLSELELSAVAEAANQTMAAAASAIGVVLGQAIEISPPDTRVLEDPSTAARHYGTAPHAISTTFAIGDESCRLIQLVPSAFVLRMARAIDERTSEQAAGAAAEVASAEPGGRAAVGLDDALGEIALRVWAELGRTRMPLGRALALPVGAVVDLDRAADAPVDVYVNGVRFARGRLVVNDGEWAIAVDELTTLGPVRGALGVATNAGPPQAGELAPAITEPELEGALT